MFAPPELARTKTWPEAGPWDESRHRDAIVRSASLSSKRDATADVIGVAMRINHHLNRAIPVPGQLQVRMQVTQRINDDRLPFTHEHVAQASACRPANLINPEARAFEDCPRLIMLSPALHSTAKARARVPQPLQASHHKLRSLALRAHSKYGHIFGKLVGQLSPDASDNSIDHVVLATDSSISK